MIEGFHTREGVYFRRDRYDNVTVIVAESAQVAGIKRDAGEA